MSSHIDNLDGLNETLAKAKALALMTYGESGEKFRGMCDEMQDTYLWALSDIIESANKYLAQLQDELTGTKGGANGS